MFEFYTYLFDQFSEMTLRFTPTKTLGHKEADSMEKTRFFKAFDLRLLSGPCQDIYIAKALRNKKLVRQAFWRIVSMARPHMPEESGRGTAPRTPEPLYSFTSKCKESCPKSSFPSVCGVD
jgi:hypothetical protein